MRGAEWVLLALALGCAQPNPTPPSWRRTVEQAQRSPFGAWTAVTLRDGRVMSGELLAAEERGVVLGAGLAANQIPRQCVSLVQVGAFDASTTPVIAAGIVGLLSTITNGFFLVFTAPVWATVFVYNAYAISGKGHFEQVTALGNLAIWARFPQGLPAPFRERLTLSWVDISCGP
jgi:hypothetical protein